MLLRGWLSPSEKLEYVNQLLLYGRWLRAHKPPKLLSDRFDLFEYINTQILADAPITYLEFGVFKGDSIKKWSEINISSQSEFFGFDSFEGLPADWNLFDKSLSKGDFDVHGEIPRLDDLRVEFLKGHFQDSLPIFLSSFQPKNTLVIHCDADLYSSELFVLTSIDRLLNPGAILIFDDFGAVNHDFKAFVDYTESYMKNYKVLAFGGQDRSSTAIQIL